MAIVDGKYVELKDDWVIMRTPCTKEMVRCKRYKIPFLLSVGYKLGWDVYREKFQELETLKFELGTEMSEMKRQIAELEMKE